MEPAAGVALFCSLAAYAGQAEQVVPALCADLTAAIGAAQIADVAMSEFVACFARQARADDPTAVIPGCEHTEPVPGDPVDDVFEHAVSSAMKINFTRPMQSAAVHALGAVVVTFLLMFALPRGNLDKKVVIKT